MDKLHLDIAKTIVFITKLYDLDWNHIQKSKAPKSGSMATRTIDL